ncbi:hypothetical protein M9H77_29773 [Catharanthus roseus]|uniref:Uncharacterized protein n=1 Tax=Catharanthus roseus TaxID=4058 RepID=A0ACB9ZVQ4_CATRO|nr:hypothetical protein M9H77_29773 [Catharanthus roseus]
MMETRICLLENLRRELPTGEGVRPKKKPIPLVRTNAPIYMVSILDYLVAEAACQLTRKSKCMTSGIIALVEAMMKTVKDQVAGSNTTNVESSQHGRGREEQRDPVIPKARGKSKDLTASFESRLTRVEEGMGTVDAHIENIDQRVEGLEADIAETPEEVREALTKLGESNRVDLHALSDKFMAEVACLRDVHQKELNSLLMQLEES